MKVSMRVMSARYHPSGPYPLPRATCVDQQFNATTASVMRVRQHLCEPSPSVPAG